MRTALVTVLLLFSAMLTAQVSTPISNSVDEDQERLHRFDINFGAGGAATVSVNLSGDNGSSGLRAMLIDRDELVVNGAATAFNQDSDPGTGPVTPSLAVTYSGIRTFVVVVSLENNSSGPANYTGTISVATVATAITDSGNELRDDSVSMANPERMFNIGVRGGGAANNGSSAIEFRVDFGAGNAADFWVHVEGQDEGTVEVFVMNAGTGLPVAVSPSGGITNTVGGNWEDEGNFTTPTLTGMQRIRVVMSTALTTDVGFRVDLAFSSNVSVPAFTEIHIMGSLSANQRRFHRFQLDYGLVATSLVIMQYDMMETGSIRTVAFDADDLSSNGPATAMINLPHWTPAYPGVRDFFIVVEEDGGSTADYHYVLTVALPLAAVTVSTPQTGLSDDPYGQYFNRIVVGQAEVDMGASASIEYLVDFGTGKSIDFWANADGGDDGQVVVSEVLATGALSALGSPLSGTGSWDDNDVFTSSLRSGLVRFRLTATAPLGMDFKFSVLLPSNVTLVAITQLTFTGTLTADQSRFHRFQIIFGSNTTDYSVFLHSYTVTGTIDVQFVDLDELAANGSSTAFATQPPFQTASYTGTREFLFNVIEGSGTVGATYTINLAVASTAASVTGSQVLADDDSLQFIFNRAAQRKSAFTAAGSVTSEFEVNFGSTAHTAQYWFMGSADDASFELFEIAADGTAISRELFAVTGGSMTESNGATGSRSGRVRFRVVVAGNAVGDSEWAVVFDSTVTVGAIGSGKKKKGGGGDEGGCSTDGGNNPWLALMGVLALLALATRLRRA